MRWPNPIEWALTAALVIALLFLAWNFDPFGRRKKAEARADVAEAQASSDQAGQHIEARRSQNTRKAQAESEEGRRAVAEAPDLDRALVEWRSAMERVRQSSHLPVTDADGS